MLVLLVLNDVQFCKHDYVLPPHNNSSPCGLDASGTITAPNEQPILLIQ